MKLILLLLLCANMAFAQSEITPFPFDTVGFPKVFIQDMQMSNYYAFVYLPDIYETPDGKRYEVFTKKKKRIDASMQTYETLKEWYHYPPRLERKPNADLPKGTKLIDPVYQAVTTQKEVLPATSKWVERRGDSSTLHYNVDFAHVVIFLEVPAQYQTMISKYEELKPARKIVGKDTVTLDSATLFQYYWEVHEKKLIISKKNQRRKFKMDTLYRYLLL